MKKMTPFFSRGLFLLRTQTGINFEFSIWKIFEKLLSMPTNFNQKSNIAMYGPSHSELSKW